MSGIVILHFSIMATRNFCAIIGLKKHSKTAWMSQDGGPFTDVSMANLKLLMLARGMGHFLCVVCAAVQGIRAQTSNIPK